MTETADAPPTAPFAIDDVPWEEWSEGVRFGGKVRSLSNTRDGSGRKIGIAIEELAPGKQSSPFHYHLVEEEHMMFLEGTATLRLGEQRYRVKAGDFVTFPAGQKAGHCMVNDGDAPCRYLIIGDHAPDEVCVYPDSGKIMVRALGRNGFEDIFKLSATHDYYEGEKADEPPA